jgi:hypothetical protein
MNNNKLKLKKKNKQPHNTLLSRSAAIKILSKRYPTNEELERFPLGDILLQIPKTDKRYSNHSKLVMNGVNTLLSTNNKHPHQIVKEWNGNRFEPTDPTVRLFTETVASIRKSCHMSKYDFEAFFRLIGLYHDIGKSVIKARHPIVGYHLIKEVHRKRVEKELFPYLLNVDKLEWEKRLQEKELVLSYEEKRIIKLFEDVLRYHDLFGTLSTGESSIPVMVDLVALPGSQTEHTIELISVLTLFNIADLYASVEEIFPYKIEYYCKDWELLCKAVNESKGSRKLFFEYLLNIEQGQERSLERIRRFLDIKSKDFSNEHAEDLVEECFRQASLGTMHSFNKNFALLCKLDYALSYKNRFVKIAKDNKISTKRIINELLWLIVQITRQYGDVCTTNDGSYRRIGVDLSGLTRTDSITNTICELILKFDTGKEWAIGECGIWFMDE